jgi:LuxR family maltose regulon positive regulatory protein
VPAGSRLVLAGRDAPPLRIARLRAEGRITEVGSAELSLTVREAAALLRAADVRLDTADVVRLHQRTEGWPVGLYLAALYLREGGSVGDAAASFGGDDRLVSEYLESELLNRISGSHREFLTRSAALTSMTGALCEAALDLPGAAGTLADLARSNMLLVPLDRRGQWYRYHHLFGDMLRAELERREPGVMAAVRRRAAQWCLENDQPEEAVEYSIGAQDTEVAARLVEQIGFGVYWHGRRDRLDRWIRWLEERDAIRARPMIAVIAGFLCLSTIRVPEAERWAGLLDRWQYAEAGWVGDRGTEAYAAMLRASVCRKGADQMAADVDEAVEKFAAEGIETPNLIVYRGLVCILRGQLDTADALFQDAISESEANDMQEILACSLYERSLFAMARGDWTAARGFADRLRAAIKRPGSEEVFVWVVHARVAAHDRDLSTARDALARAQPLRALMPMPVFAVQNRLELCRAYLALNDMNGARTVMHESEEILQRHPDLGSLAKEVDAMRSLVDKGGRSRAVGPSALTTAELRLLPMLTTHLTYQEIADELFLSRHTIHAQVKSLFRKLGATSRSEAVARSQELALLER